MLENDVRVCLMFDKMVFLEQRSKMQIAKESFKTQSNTFCSRSTFRENANFCFPLLLLFSSPPFPCVVYYYTTCIVCVGLNAESLALSPHPSPNILGNKSSFSVPEMTSLFCTIIHKNTFSFMYLQFTMCLDSLLGNNLVDLLLILIDL